jgi:acetyl esterase
VSVEYRKAPEHPFPAALNDAVAAYQWVLANAATFNGNPLKVAVAGESAGGNLATEVCLQARDLGFAMPVHELLVYPVTDFSVNYNSDRTYYNAQPLNTPALLYFTKNYLTDPADATTANASPLKGRLAGLPSTTSIAAQIDPLQDEGALMPPSSKPPVCRSTTTCTKASPMNFRYERGAGGGSRGTSPGSGGSTPGLR